MKNNEKKNDMQVNRGTAVRINEDALERVNGGYDSPRLPEDTSDRKRDEYDSPRLPEGTVITAFNP